MVNAQAGLVVVRAMPNERRIVEDYLGVTHATVNRQVILEAKIVEVESSRMNSSPVLTGTLLSQNTEARCSSSRKRRLGQRDRLRFRRLFSLLIQTGDFTVLLDAPAYARRRADSFEPARLHGNNQKAVIKVGGDEFFATGVSGGTSVAATGATTTTTPSPSPEPLLLGHRA